MIAKAITRYLRISPRKTRLVADMVRGKPIDEARAILDNLNKGATVYVGQTLDSAVANATSNPEISASDLFVSKITVDGGPMLKRYRAGSMGRAMMIRHRTSHIYIEVDLKKKHAKKQVGQKGQEARVRGQEPKKPLKAKTAPKEAKTEKKETKTKKAIAKK